MYPTIKPIPGHLNVVFHGMFVYVNWGQAVEVLVPRVQGHRYLMGTWMSEINMHSGVYRLEGLSHAIRGPRPLFDAQCSFAFSGFSVVDRERAHARIFMPIPAMVQSLRVAKLDPAVTAITGAHAPQITAKQIAFVHVFIYHFADWHALRVIRGWEPCFHSETQTVNLHVFAEPELMMGHDAGISFDRAVGLTPGLDCKVRKLGKTTFGSMPPPDCPTGVPGLPTVELETLAERQPEEDLKANTVGLDIENCVGYSQDPGSGGGGGS